MSFQYDQYLAQHRSNVKREDMIGCVRIYQR